MTGQTSLFDAPAGRARHTDPTTSVTSARAMNAAALEARIIHTFQTWGPLTDDELCGHLEDVYPPTVKSARSRITALVASGETRLSNRGRPMCVWVLRRRVETVNDIGTVEAP